MINLLPPSIKKQRAYSKYNRTLRGLTILTLVFGVILALTMFAGNFYVGTLIDASLLELENKEEEVADYSDVSKEAEELNSQITGVINTLDKTTRYSVLIKDIGRLLPANTYIESLELDGSSASPLTLIVISNTEDDALSTQFALADSDLFSSIDVIFFQKVDSRYQMELVLAYKDPGAALGNTATPQEQN